MPRGYKWEVQYARKSKKGRAMGGIIMGIRKELKDNGTEIVSEREEIMVERVSQGGKF